MSRDITFELDLIRAFIAVAETRSFTRAAQRLHRTQSAVSMKIKRLETQAGCRLFDRDTTAVRLTPIGENFLGTARKLIEVSEEAYFTLNRDFADGRLTLATSETYAAVILPPTLAKFYEKFPRIEIEIQCGHSWVLLDALDLEKMDVAVATRSPKRTDGVLLRRERLHWIASKESSVHTEHELPLAVFPEGCCYRQAALAALRDIGRPARIAYTSSNHEGLMSAVAAGRAVTPMIESALSEKWKILGAAEQLPELPPVDIMLYRAPNISPAAKLFAQTVEEHFHVAEPTAKP